MTKIAVTIAVLALIWWLNRLIVKLAGQAALITFVPLIEETGKTITALLTGVPIMAVHMVFGGVEGVSDIITGTKRGA